MTTIPGELVDAGLPVSFCDVQGNSNRTTFHEGKRND